MFLVDSALAAADWEGTVGVIENILKRADAEVVALRKWGERRLAFEIAHKSRGTYILSYFRADPQRIAGLEKDVQLSEKVMRVLVLGTEKRPADVLEADITGVAKEAEPEAAEGAATAAAETAQKPGAQEKPAQETSNVAAEKPAGAETTPPAPEETVAQPSAPETVAAGSSEEPPKAPSSESAAQATPDSDQSAKTP
jgi:small subunit ribosomal protein S6